MIKSEIRHGQIYSGSTPLVSTIAVVQTGPMQLTVRAGSFTTTGQSRIVRETGKLSPADFGRLDALIGAGGGEWGDADWARVWLADKAGALQKAQTFALLTDQVLNLTSDPVDEKAYQAELGVYANVLVDILLRSRFEKDPYPDPPTDWEKIHDLIFEFPMPPGTVDLSGLGIYVLTVLPGFPPGTGAADWLTQLGQV